MHTVDHCECDQGSHARQVYEYAERHEPGKQPDEGADDEGVVHWGEGARVHPVEDLWEHPVAPHGEQNARLAVEHDQRNAEDPDGRASGQPDPVTLRMITERPASWPANCW